MGDQELTGDKGTKTLTSSGCGTFAMSCIVSGLLGMEIDPITYLNNLDEYFPYGNYYSYDNGSNPAVFDEGYLKKYYGLSVKWWQGATPSRILDIVDEMNGQCAIIGYRPGHYIAYAPALDNKGYKFYVIDSIQELTGGYTSDEEFRNSSGYYPYTYAIIYY